METTKNMQSQAGRTSRMKTAAGIVGICLAVLGLGAMISLFVDYRSSETTDDAQIEQYLSPVLTDSMDSAPFFAGLCVSLCSLRWNAGKIQESSVSIFRGMAVITVC